MWSLFKVECLRFRTWALIAAAVHLCALGFGTRMLDLAQQTLPIYRGIGAVYALAGVLLGLHQIGGYRRGSHWVTLLHRPVPAGRIALTLCAAAGVVLLVAIMLPTLLLAAWQQGTTARVVDHRHWLLPGSAWLVAVAGYLAGAFWALRGMRLALAAAALLVWLVFAEATGVAMLTLELLVVAWLLALVLCAFKPDVEATPRGPWANALLALPLSAGAYLVAMLVLFGVEFLWIAQGSHPLNMAVPPRGGHTEVEKMEPRARMLRALREAMPADVDRLEAAVKASKPQGLAARLREQPQRDALGNLTPLQFNDPARHVRWTFSHDRMRLVGENLLNGRAVGMLGVGSGGAAFPHVAVPLGHLPGLPEDDTVLLAGDTLYRYDSAGQVILPWLSVRAGELIAGVGAVGRRWVLMSDKALYVFRTGSAGARGPTRIPLPIPNARLSNLDMIALSDGVLISLVSSELAHTEDGARPSLWLLRGFDDGRPAVVHASPLSFDYPALHRYRSWWPSPALHTAVKQAQALFAPPSPLSAAKPAPTPTPIAVLAGCLMLASAAMAVYRAQRGGLTGPARLAWTLFCATLGLPGLVAMLLMTQRTWRRD
ncbi:hypothetical protein [Pseudoxanthomonas sp. JBR18]|uniref:hypothetical protein n=1 Tax=Pseudoxanthomonas sp. JBR18 TaxID=2969308 RepID=UPI0023057D55|nr:hypothetical protein [Pseudoxanthomonas sp. JBR18]WCE06187.1 hypothetical protein PJ250_09675 [Pseudoxanthomonas sp. JBR18]